ncbi:hypothetical protein PG989_010627 [Apiospora arundinis]
MYLTKASAFLVAMFLSFQSGIHAKPVEVESRQAASRSVTYALRKGELEAVCNDGHYNTVALSFIDDFNENYMNWAFDGATCKQGAPCSTLKETVQRCQSKGIKVFVSMGGVPIPDRPYRVPDEKAAQFLASELQKNFFRADGPLGKLDGVDLDLEDNPGAGVPALIKALKALPEAPLVTMAPQCPWAPQFMATYFGASDVWALPVGKIDWLNMQFYNNPSCSLTHGAWNDGTAEAVQWWDKMAGQLGTKWTLGVDATQDSKYATTGEQLKESMAKAASMSSNMIGFMAWRGNHAIKARLGESMERIS